MSRTPSRAQKLAALLCLLGASTASAQVVDLPTRPLGSPESVAPPAAGFQPPQAQNAPPTALQPPGALQPPAPLDLPTTPNAPIDQLAPPQPFPAAPAANLSGGALPAGWGATAASFSAAPTMMGDFFGGGLSGFSGAQSASFAGYAPGTIVFGSPGAASSILAFEIGSDVVPNDIFTSGFGQDLAGGSDGADTFDLLEPVPPSDALTAPGPGFVYDGGTAVYTGNSSSTTAQSGIYNDGDLWYIQYSYTNTLNEEGVSGHAFVPVPGPGVAARRVKISENFSPEVRDRFFTNYSFFNDAYGGLGDISRFVLGFERILWEDLISIEARLPMAATYGSFQNLDASSQRSFELGNAALIGKAVLFRNHRWLVSGGAGVAMPIADDTRLTQGGNEILRIENETVHLLPFLAALYRKNAKTSMQAYMQLDVAANGDPVLGNLLGGPLENLGTFTDSTLMHIDVALHRQIYQNRRGGLLRGVIANVEAHYTGTLQDSDVVTQNGLTYANLKSNFNVVNSTVGLHLMLGDRLVLTPAVAVPLRDGLDRQFDYEAIVQLNYLR